MDRNGEYVIGIDIGGTKCAVTLIQLKSGFSRLPEDYIFVEKTKFKTTEIRHPDQAIAAFIGQIHAFIVKYGIERQTIRCIGISCGGPLSSELGLILSPPNLPGWDRVPIVQRLAREFSVPVKLQNDANACALAEWKFGAGQGLRNMVFLTFGTGMGAGLILDGKLYSGTNGMAGEVGHIRLAPNGPYGYGKNGSFEGFCSGAGIADLGRQLVLEKLERHERVSLCPDIGRLSELSADSIGRAAEAGDPTALEIFRTSGVRLGMALSFLIDILNPQAIVIGSIFGRQYDLLWPAAKEVLECEALSHSLGVCEVKPAGLGERIGDFAALAVAMNNAEMQRQ
jgi:glucokinase